MICAKVSNKFIFIIFIIMILCRNQKFFFIIFSITIFGSYDFLSGEIDKEGVTIFPEFDNHEIFDNYNSDMINSCTDESLNTLLKKLEETARLQIFDIDAPENNSIDTQDLEEELYSEVIRSKQEIEEKIAYDALNAAVNDFNVYNSEEDESDIIKSTGDSGITNHFEHAEVMNDIRNAHNKIIDVAHDIIGVKKSLDGVINQYNAYFSKGSMESELDSYTSDIVDNSDDNDECIIDNGSVIDNMEMLIEQARYFEMIRQAAIIEWLELLEGKKPKKKSDWMQKEKEFKNENKDLYYKKKNERNNFFYNTKKYSISNCADCMKLHRSGCKRCIFRKL